MSETPSWLSPANDAAAGGGGGTDNNTNAFEMTSGVTPESTSNHQIAAGPTASGATSAAAADDQDLPGVILTMRLANMGVAIALVACSVRRLLLWLL